MDWREFVDIWTSAPPPIPVFYRLYHDDQGQVLFYSMEDLPGNYIEIDADTYARASTRVRVVNGKIVPINQAPGARLYPGTHGTPCDPWSVCIVTDQLPALYWSKQTNETN